MWICFLGLLCDCTVFLHTRTWHEMRVRQDSALHFSAATQSAMRHSCSCISQTSDFRKFRLTHLCKFRSGLHGIAPQKLVSSICKPQDPRCRSPAHKRTDSRGVELSRSDKSKHSCTVSTSASTWIDVQTSSPQIAYFSLDACIGTTTQNRLQMGRTI